MNSPPRMTLDYKVLPLIWGEKYFNNSLSRSSRNDSVLSPLSHERRPHIVLYFHGGHANVWDVLTQRVPGSQVEGIRKKGHRWIGS